jgi:alpha-L-rhamnosidase
LARKAIHDYHSSILPDGMLQSRYPASGAQVIPGFALYWIYMVHDHHQFFADAALVRRYRATIDAVLDYFERKLTEEGLVGRLEPHYWSFVDWTKEWNPNHGVPPAGNVGPLTVYSLMYAVALKNAAELCEYTGRTDVAREYRERAQRVQEAVRRTCWSEESGLFRDGPQVEQYSQHAQLWAILSGTIQGDEAVKLMERTLTDKSLSQASYAMSFFTFRALSMLGMYEQAFALWDTWRRMVDLKLTTWVEDPVGQRSDCHAWGAVPLYEFPAEILGVKAGAPGFERIVVEPKLGHLSYAEGTVVTAKGEVRVSVTVSDEGKQRIAVQGPEGIPLTLRLPDGVEVPFINASNVLWEGVPSLRENMSRA